MAKKKKYDQGGPVQGNKFTIPPKTSKPGTPVEGNKFSVPTRKVTRSYTGTTQAEGDSMLKAFKQRNPGFKAGGKLKKKK